MANCGSAAAIALRDALNRRRFVTCGLGDLQLVKPTGGTQRAKVNARTLKCVYAG